MRAEANFRYVYILVDEATGNHFYIGCTEDLKASLEKHTSKFRPWKVETYIAFESEEKSTAFEHYLKSGSGHAFAKRHF
ncbi:MAG: GIY-YIG nuclease family protein [Lentisphaerae bacterium]|nr:GIY-YIG nuclease family protein [Lentisphaerota bacterium]